MEKGQSSCFRKRTSGYHWHTPFKSDMSLELVIWYWRPCMLKKVKGKASPMSDRELICKVRDVLVMRMSMTMQMASKYSTIFKNEIQKNISQSSSYLVSSLLGHEYSSLVVRSSNKWEQAKLRTEKTKFCRHSSYVTISSSYSPSSSSSLRKSSQSGASFSLPSGREQIFTLPRIFAQTKPEGKFRSPVPIVVVVVSFACVVDVLRVKNSSALL